MTNNIEQSFVNITPEKIIPNIKSGLNKVGFLFGAGTSKEAGFPLTYELTTTVISQLDDDSISKLESIFKLENELGQSKYSIQEPPDIELILNIVLKHIYNTGDENSKSLEKDIKELIVKTLTSIQSESLQNHIEFLSVIKRKLNGQATPFWILTTNYDMLFEKASMYAELPLRNGFEGIGARYFNIRKMKLTQGTLAGQMFHPYKEPHCNLVKLHGSVSWYEKQDKIFEILDQNFITEELNRVMIHPQKTKHTETYASPYQQLFDYTNDSLGKDCKHLIACGYSFRDEHINQRLLLPKLSDKSIKMTALLPKLDSNMDEFLQHNTFNYITSEKVRIEGKEYNIENNELWKFSKFVEFLKQ